MFALAESPDDLKTVDSRQHNVQHHNIEAICLRMGEAVESVERKNHAMAFFFKARLQRFSKTPFVFHDKDMQKRGCSLRDRCRTLSRLALAFEG
jgi:xylose isomerase